jgi:hypothetical protein
MNIQFVAYILKASCFFAQPLCNLRLKMLSIIALALLPFTSSGQTLSNEINTIELLPDRLTHSINKNADRMQKRLTQKTVKCLARLQKQEAKLKRKLRLIDTTLANQIFAGSTDKYQHFQQQINEKATGVESTIYLPVLDTLKTSLKFLSQQGLSLKNNASSYKSIKTGMEQLQQLQNKFSTATSIQQFIKERKQLLTTQLAKYGLAKQLLKFNKTAYYYHQQIAAYKSIINNPSKLVAQSISLLNKLPLFKDFFSKYSQLAALFPAPAYNGLSNNGGSLQIPGLQTRWQVQQQLQSIVSSAAGGTNNLMVSQNLLTQNIQDAQSQLHQLKNKLNEWGGGSSELEMPEGFKPNHQKTKSFWSRLACGTNLQSQKSTYFLPTTTDIGLSVGYKLNDQSIIGIGSSYKIGWGRNIRNIQLSSEGISIRSFIDVKLKGSFYISGGYEKNYRQKFYNWQQLKNQPNNWSSSSLLGISKIVSLKTKFLKQTKLQLLYDILWQQQIPVGPPVKFRIGYGF